MTWREIPGYDGMYLVSDTGEILSRKNGRYRILKQRISLKGYPQVNLLFKSQ